MPTISEQEEILKKNMKRRGQLWIFWSMECEDHYKWQYQYEVLNLFDIKATYKLDSDIPVPYFSPTYFNDLRNAPVSKTDFVNAFISSGYDRSNRIKCLNELMNFLNIHSYGKINNNIDFIEDEGGSQSKQKVISKYKFTIAFENAIAVDYVTEKFYEPLITGSVPIYLGAPNIEKFAPGEDCYINVNSFSSTRELASYLLHLDKNDEEYNKYLKWKKLPFKNSFVEIFTEASNIPPLIKLCHEIKNRLYI